MVEHQTQKKNNLKLQMLGFFFFVLDLNRKSSTFTASVSLVRQCAAR